METILELKNRKITKMGNSYAVLINKTYITDGNLNLNKVYDVIIKLPIPPNNQVKGISLKAGQKLPRSRPGGAV